MARKAHKKLTKQKRVKAEPAVKEVNEPIGPQHPLEAVRANFERCGRVNRILLNAHVGAETARRARKDMLSHSYDLAAAVDNLVEYTEATGYRTACPDVAIPSGLFSPGNTPRLVDLLIERLRFEDVELAISQLSSWVRANRSET